MVIQSIVSFEQEPYPLHIAKGDNTKCFTVLTHYRTLPHHLVHAEKKPDIYINAFKFYRWTKDEETNKDKVATFKVIQGLKTEERKQISDGLYRIQRVNDNKFNVYLTPKAITVAEYFNNKFKQRISTDKNKESLTPTFTFDNDNQK
jgi:hypothetical protein